jgi:hypothetical protein
MRIGRMQRISADFSPELIRYNPLHPPNPHSIFTLNRQ